jgi:23S rRNA (guanosine2251-2'-O)-methyltransferase
MEKSDMIYGTRTVMEAINAGKPIEKIMIQSGLNNDLIKELVGLARMHKVPVSFVPQERLKRLSTKNHQGVICLMSAVTFGSLNNVVQQAFSEGRDPFLLILDRITDVRNFGAIVRTAECAGVDAIIIPEKGSAPVTSDAMKTSAGALNHVPVCRERDLTHTLKFLRDSGIRIVACTEKTKTSLYDTSLQGPIALILGSEEDGVSPELLRSADDLARIPLRGKIGSLNVSVAAGVAIYETIRQQLQTRS